MTIRVGFIGCGAISLLHMRAYRTVPDVEVVACSDVMPQRAEKFALDNNIAHHFTSHEEMLAAVALDCVSICTPNFAHAVPTVHALEAGVHVLCEKPIAMNAEEAATMVEAANRTGKLLTIGHHMRFNPIAQYLKSLVDQGDLGTIYYGRSHALRRRLIPGWGQFHIKSKSGGGPLIDIGVHALDLIIWLMGSPTPATVSGSVYTMFGNRENFYNPRGEYNRADYDVEDFASAYVRFTNGASLSLEASWAAHIKEEEHYPQLVLGDKAGLEYHPVARPPVPDPVRIYSTSNDTLIDTIPSGFPVVEPHIEEIRQWIECVRGEKEVIVKPQECLNVQRILDGIYKSSAEHREIVLQQN